MTTKRRANPERYARLSVPVDRDTANENLEKFHKELGELREKYAIPDLFIVARANVKYEDKVGEYITSFHYGDPLKAEALAAFGFGEAKQEHREIINRLIASAGG